MLWDVSTLAHTSTTVSYELIPLPGVSADAVVTHMKKIAASFPINLNRADNIGAQNFHKTTEQHPVIIWNIHWHGTGNSSLILNETNAFIRDMQDQINLVSVIRHKHVTTLEAALRLS